MNRATGRQATIYNYRRQETSRMMEKEHSNLHLTKVEGKQERNGGNLGMD